MMNLETMKSQFTGEYRAAFDNAYKYILTHSFPKEYTEEKMAELYDLLLTAQEEGKPAEKIVGADPAAFCKEFFSDMTPENRFAGVLHSLFGVSCVLVLFSAVDWLCAEEVRPFLQFRLNASPMLCGLLGGFLLSAVLRFIQPIVMKSKKISAGGWAVIFCAMLIPAVGIARALMPDRDLSLPGAPVLIGAAAFILLYLIVRAALRYRKTGSFFAKKADDLYKDSYYKTLEDKDLRRIIEKQWMKRYLRMAKRGKTTEATFRDEITRLERINGILNRIQPLIYILIVVSATVFVAPDSTPADTLFFLVMVSAAALFVALLFRKADRENSIQRRHILADADASGMSLPAFLAQELDAAR